MPDIIITPSSGKLEFVDNSTQTIRRHSFTLDAANGIVLDAPFSASSVTAPLNVINVTAGSSNVNYPFIFASSGETGAKSLLMDSAGGTYNPSTNTATIDITGNSATTTLASNSTNLGGVAAASYVTLTGTQTLTNKTITGTFTGNLTGTGSWATNAVNANTATNSTQLNGQADSYYTNIPARLGYTPVNKAGDTISGNLTVNGNFAVNGSVTAFSASNIYITSSTLTVTDNILLMNALSPYQRYAGIQMYDSGSNTLSQFLWDGEGDYFFLTGSSVNGKIITGPDGQTNLSSNYIPKATAGYKLGNSLLYDNGTNVGIGTTTPSGKLSTGATSGMKLLVYDNAATGVYTGLGQDLAAGNSTDLFAHSVSNLGFITFGKIGTNGTTYTEWARFNTSGSLGIGTNNPSYKLDVTGSLGVNASSADNNWPFVVSDNSSAGSRYSLNKYGSMGFNNADNYAQLQLLGSAGAYVDFTNSIGGDSNARLIYYAGSRLDLTYGFATTITLNGTGVGIGTTGPTGELHVYGTQPAFRIQSSVSGSMQFGQWDGTYNRIQSSARDFLLISTDATNLIFSTNGTERMRILSGGNIGIGTTSAAQKLDVVGNIRCVPASSAWAEGLSFSMPTTSSWGGLRWRRERGNADGNHYIGYIGTDTTDDLVFGSNNAGTQIDNNIRITKAGLVGVGTSSPVTKFHVVGVISGSSFSGAGTGLTGTASGLSIGGNAATVTNGAYLNTSQTFTAVSTFAVPSRTTSYTTPSIQVYTGDNTPPGIAFHRGGVSATYLYESDGELYTNPWTTRGQTGKLLAAGNYTDYTVTKTGTGASGTWAITSSWATNAVNVNNATLTVAAGTGISLSATPTFTANASVDKTITITNGGVTSLTTNTGLSSNVSATGAVTVTNTGVTAITTNTGLSTNASATGAVTITNTGVTSNVAGTGISVSGATGAVTITNSGVTSAVAGTGVGVSGATGAVTFSIGQAVGTGNSPTFAGATINGQLQVNNATPTSILRIFSGGSTVWSIGVGDSAGSNFNISADFGSILINKSTGNIWISGSGINNTVLHSNSTLTAGNLSGTIPSGVLGNSTHYVGTTAIALNRGSASQTLTGVSIDGNAATVGTLSINTSGRNDVANQIVRTDSNGYIQAGWINTTSGDNGTTAIDRVYASSDGYIRYYTPANFRTVLDVPTRGGSGASGTWGISVTGTAAGETLGTVTGRGASTGTQITVATSAGGTMFTGRKAGASYGDTVSGATFKSITDNPNGGSYAFASYYSGSTGFNSFYVDALGWGYFSGSVGIGTTSPTARLHVSGSTGGIFEVDTAGGATTLYVSASGNIGIGTVTPATKLDVYGPVSIRGTTILTTNFDLNAGNAADIYGNIRVLRGASLNDGMYIGYGGAGGPLRFFSNSGTTEFVTIATSGFVGIGSTAPAALLNIRASAPTGIGSTPTGTNLLIDSNTNNYITFRNTADNGTYAGLIFLDNNVGGYIAFGNSGASVGSDSMIYGAYQDHIFQNNYVNETLFNRTETMRIKQSGNVGIGTSSPSSRVHIYENANRVTYIAQNNLHTARFEAYGTATAIDTTASNGIFFRINGGDIVKFAADGNVGIGTNTVTAKVESYFSSNAVTINYLATNLNGNSPIPVYGFDVTNGSGETRSIKAGIGYERHLTNGRGTLHFYNDSTNDTQSLSGNRTSAGDIKMSIDNDGNVGIGSVTPSYKLHVMGNGYFSSTLQVNSNITLSGGGDVIINDSDGTGTFNSFMDSGIGYIRIDDGGSANGKLNINSGLLYVGASGGNVGIGSTSPACKLDVVGTIRSTTTEIFGFGASDNVSIRAASTSNVMGLYTSNSEKVRIDASGNVGIGTSNPGRKLDVEGIVRTRGASGTGGFEIGAATTGTAKWRIEWDSASDSLDFNWVG